MKKMFDDISDNLGTMITQKYSTSFSLAVGLLGQSIRQDIYNIYGFVRTADEIVDSFHGLPQEEMLDRFQDETNFALKSGISTNPIINAFQSTVRKYDIPRELIDAFLKSMRFDLTKKVYANQDEIDEYIFGSADVVGLMCLMVFVKGDLKEYERLKEPAMRLGSAFQKVNFLRDLKADYEDLNRAYFPSVDPGNFTELNKERIVAEIEEDFRFAAEGIAQLPREARFGVYLAFKYYTKLLQKIVRTPAVVIVQNRIRVSNSHKFYLLFNSYMKYKFNRVSWSY